MSDKKPEWPLRCRQEEVPQPPQTAGPYMRNEYPFRDRFYGRRKDRYFNWLCDVLGWEDYRASEHLQKIEDSTDLIVQKDF